MGVGGVVTGTVQIPVAVLTALLTVLASAFGVIWWCVRRIISGDMVPRQTYADLLADRNDWRDAARESGGQVGKLMEVGEFTSAVLGALEGKAREGQS